MSSALELTSIHVRVFINIFGIILNGFIVLMNIKAWIRKNCLPSGDKIVTSLCLSRWIFQCLITMNQIFHLLFPRVNMGYLNIGFNLARILLNYSSIWFASLLCVYYCVKIANYKHAMFLYLKVNMSRLVPGCLGLCLVFSFLFFLPTACKLLFPPYKSVTSNAFRNMTKKKTTGQSPYIIGSSPPLVIFTIAFFLTVPSLWKHIRKINGVGTYFRGPDMQTHYNAIKSMAAFFLLHIMFIISVNVILSGVLKPGSPYILLLLVLSAFYPCLHSAVIIFYNRKLRKGFLYPLTCVLSKVQK